MPVLILDPHMEAKYRSLWAENDSNRFDEVWDGVLVVAPLPNNEHQEIQFKLLLPLAAAVDEPQLGRVSAGVNVSDRADQWEHNYRGPDVVVYLHGNPAVNHGTHWEGGPDFLAEIISPGEKPYDKFDFYAKVNTREVLVAHRDPWWVELHQLQGGKLTLAGRSELPASATLTSSVLPLTFRLVAGTPRPKIEVVHPPTGRRWEA